MLCWLGGLCPASLVQAYGEGGCEGSRMQLAQHVAFGVLCWLHDSQPSSPELHMSRLFPAGISLQALCGLGLSLGRGQAICRRRQGRSDM